MVKKLYFMLAMAMAMWSINVTAQDMGNGKISPELQEILNNSSPDEMHRVMIVMAEQYDSELLAEQTRDLDHDAACDFVYSTLSAYAEASQQGLLEFLQSGEGNGVENVNSLWIVNALGCALNRDWVYAVAERDEVEWVLWIGPVVLSEVESSLNSGSILGSSQQHKSIVNEKTKETEFAWHVLSTRANQVWDENVSNPITDKLGKSIKGSGIRIALLDSGLRDTHFAICNNLDITVGHTNRNPLVHPTSGLSLPLAIGGIDHSGHGTACAGVLVGNSPNQIHIGIAPGALIQNIQATDYCFDTDLLTLKWCLQCALLNYADIICIPNAPKWLDRNSRFAFRMALELMVAGKIVVCAAAGDYGEKYYTSPFCHYLPPNWVPSLTNTPIYNTWFQPNSQYYYYNLGIPGMCPPPWLHPAQTKKAGTTSIISVGASNRNFRKATFSSFGPADWSNGFYMVDSVNIYEIFNDYDLSQGEELIRPDLVAPGVDITTSVFWLDAIDSLKCIIDNIPEPKEGPTYTSSDFSPQNHTDLYWSHHSEEKYLNMGTSFATCCVTGVVALMMEADKLMQERYPNYHSLTPAAIDSILEMTAMPCHFQTTKNSLTGSGQVDALGAVHAVLTQAGQVTGLQVDSVNCNGVGISWIHTFGASGYVIYRDNQVIAQVSDSYYFDHYNTQNSLRPGKHVYFVRAVDSEGFQSVNSNIICVDFPDPIDLTPISGFHGTVGLGCVVDLHWDSVFAINDSLTLNGSLSEDHMELLSMDDFKDVVDQVFGYRFKYRYAPGVNFGPIPNAPKNFYDYIEWGVRFPAEDYGQDDELYIGRLDQWQIKKVKVYIHEPLGQYTLNIYTNTYLGNSTDLAPAHSQNLTNLHRGWNDILLIDSNNNPNPFTITVGDDIWVSLRATGSSIRPSTKFIPIVEGKEDQSELCYILVDEDLNQGKKIWHSPTYTNNDWASMIKLFVERQPLNVTYDVYRDGQLVCPNLWSNSFREVVDEPGTHEYRIQASCNAACPVCSESIFVNTTCRNRFIISDDETYNYSIVANDENLYLIKPTGRLTVLEELQSESPEYLVIEDGGQVVHHSDGVMATMTNTYKGFTMPIGSERPDGLHLVASPFQNEVPIESLMAESDFDIYRYNPDEQQWQSWRENPDAFCCIENGHGYLLTLPETGEVSFEGMLRPTEDMVAVPLSFVPTPEGEPGFNLIGNPLSCQVRLNHDYFVMNEDGSELELAGCDRVIKPGEAVVVMANDDYMEAMFTRVEEYLERGGIDDNTIEISLTNGKANIDRARVRIGEGSHSPKAQLVGKQSNIGFRMGDAYYASVFTNGNDLLPLNFTSGDEGVYRLVFNMGNHELEYLHLIDNLTGADIDLLANNEYEFEADKDCCEGRFLLQMKPFNDIDDFESFGHVANGNFLFPECEGGAWLQVVDMKGRIISSEWIVGGGSKPLHLTPGLYVVRLVNNDGCKTQKVVVP